MSDKQPVWSDKVGFCYMKSVKQCESVSELKVTKQALPFWLPFFYIQCKLANEGANLNQHPYQQHTTEERIIIKLYSFTQCSYVMNVG